MPLIDLQVEVDDYYGEVEKVYTLQKNSWWNTDTYLAPIILDALVQFKSAERSGTPSSMFNDDDFDESTGKYSDGAEEAASAKYEAMLDEAIETFTIINDGDADLNWEKVQAGLQTFAKIFCSLWD